MFNRRGFLATAGVALIGAPAVLRAQSAPDKKLRIVVVANRNHEADGLMAALSNQMKQNPYLSYPYYVTSPPGPLYFPTPKLSTGPRCLVDMRKDPANLVVVATMEIWCIDDLAVTSGVSSAKATAMQRITDYGPKPDGVIAFGTAGYPDSVSNDGCATIGGTIFIHDAAKDVSGNPGGTWSWPNKPEKMGVLVPSKTPASFFTGVAGDQNKLTAITNEMIIPKNNAAQTLRLITAPDAVGISSVNIPRIDGADAGKIYCKIDTGAIDLARQAGATTITSVETTHGIIRAMWEDAPFIYVTAIPNRVCYFSEEASGIYGQELPSSHNAGIALKYVISSFVNAIAP